MIADGPLEFSRNQERGSIFTFSNVQTTLSKQCHNARGAYACIWNCWQFPGTLKKSVLEWLIGLSSQKVFDKSSLDGDILWKFEQFSVCISVQ